MKTIVALAFMFAGILVLPGCCGDCNSQFLGQFFILDSSDEWVAFAQERDRIFLSPGYQPQPFRYELPEYGIQDFQFNCQSQGQCGTCCDNYQGQVVFIALRSYDETTVFSLNLQKDFLNHSPLEDPEEVPDYFSMTMNNRLTGELFLENPKYLGRVTLNGVNFDNVFAVQADPQFLDPGSRQPKAFYYRKDLGILGWELANGEQWNVSI